MKDCNNKTQKMLEELTTERKFYTKIKPTIPISMILPGIYIFSPRRNKVFKIVGVNFVNGIPHEAIVRPVISRYWYPPGNSKENVDPTDMVVIDPEKIELQPHRTMTLFETVRCLHVPNINREKYKGDCNDSI